MAIDTERPALAREPARSCERVIVLAMHGVPPVDFPPRELGELTALHGGPGSRPARLDAIQARIRSWPRTDANDPYWSGARRLASALAREAACPVIVGFNEFCDPTIEAAVDEAVALAPREILVVTPMLTRGGTHAEAEIPAAIERARARHPGVEIRYMWPVEAGIVARFLASLVRLWSEVA